LAQKHNRHFYQKAIKKYGISSLGVHWNNKFAQYKRFDVLTAFIKKDIKEKILIDVGCGFGDYYKYLYDNNLLPKKYIGIDCEDFMIDISKQRFKNQDFKIKNVLTDVLPQADYLVCSGALNILTQEEIYIFIQKCFDASKVGFVFNLLKFNGYNKLDINKLLDFCNLFQCKVEMKDNYLDNDFTIFMIKYKI
jgi:SAM-dependent methyltransferase